MHRRMRKTRMGDRQVNDAALLLYVKANGLHLVSYNYRDFDVLLQILDWGRTITAR